MKRIIKFIYFDVGGVAILDFSKTDKWNEMLDDLGLIGDTRQQFEQLFDAHERDICIGENINIFIKEATENLGVQFPLNYNMIQDFVNRFKKNHSILYLIKRLKAKYRLGLLTNQYPNMLNMIFQKELIPSDIWDVIVDSSVEGVAKPEESIYKLAEEKASVDPGSILFIDNKASLLEIPRQRGWSTFEYDPADAQASTLELEKVINSFA